MNDNAVRGFGRAFCDASMNCQPQQVAPYLRDDVEWVVYGPVDLFPLFGRLRGKQAVLTFCERMTDYLQLESWEHEIETGNDTDASGLLRVTAVHTESGRTLSLRAAYFAQFRDGKLARMVALFDSFDAAEQVMGRQIDLNRDSNGCRVFQGGA